MTTSTFTVSIDEVITHTLSVEATDSDEAYDKAREVLGNIRATAQVEDPVDGYELEHKGFVGFSSEIAE